MAFTSCNDDDEDDINPNSLEGSWKITALTMTGNGTTQPIYDETDDVVFEFDDQDMTIFIDGDLEETGTYEVKGNQIIITFDNDEVETWNIDELTSMSLKVNFQEAGSSSGTRYNATFRKL